jgi:plasmid stabilization system protein ParE
VAESEQREVVWTQAALADLQDIYEFNITLQGEEKAFELVENIRQKADMLYQPIMGSTRFLSRRHPERSYQKLVIVPYLLIFRQVGEVVFINRIFDNRQDPSKLDL